MADPIVVPLSSHHQAILRDMATEQERGQQIIKAARLAASVTAQALLGQKVPDGWTLEIRDTDIVCSPPAEAE